MRRCPQCSEEERVPMSLMKCTSCGCVHCSSCRGMGSCCPICGCTEWKQV